MSSEFSDAFSDSLNNEKLNSLLPLNQQETLSNLGDSREALGLDVINVDNVEQALHRINGTLAGDHLKGGANHDFLFGGDGSDRPRRWQR